MRVPVKFAGMKKSVKAGFDVLKAGGSFGSVLNTDGEVEMDASVIHLTSCSPEAVLIDLRKNKECLLFRLVASCRRLLNFHWMCSKGTQAT
ncbi:unnamed protein product [Callosobruchus maculatus]|uniref:Uncharacterized protein n=1 Tax=Callosobruchus maculatus TaxID=64391 RepID=A0A653D569_CALMS|nr:unnamed protein product [Callosobruchus maculatus]